MNYLGNGNTANMTYPGVVGYGKNYLDDLKIQVIFLVISFYIFRCFNNISQTKWN